jgi:hypothetical protein
LRNIAFDGNEICGIFVARFSQTFVDGKEREKKGVKESKKSKARTLMNLHNNEAGRRVRP